MEKLDHIAEAIAETGSHHISLTVEVCSVFSFHSTIHMYILF